ncbi:hypothetical protein J2Z44_004308 [Clostridium punense]|uniref:Peptidase C-terminal archaeal/bacterial domain-containing protein n=1 Tax=Clostridium punense TaxID=1054297 RepID=A0ABS4KCV9_9CLOT|nr:hypothetical protein [Clostridium punense]MBP2024439.1 hypothetical protein [Clostridium punense]
MRKLSKKIALFLFMLLFTVITTTNSAYAHVDDGAPATVINNTKETSQLITANTIQDSLDFHPKMLSSCFLSDSNDTDWYKVFLTQGTNTLTINSPYHNIVANIYSDDLVYEISTSIHGSSTKKQAKFTVDKSGTYYIRISSTETFSDKASYSLMVGAPWYIPKSYTVNLNQDLVVTIKKKYPTL